jgi:quinohemoprotein ethanol dehydrogenase
MEYDPQVIEHAGDRLRLIWDYSRGLAFWQDKVYTGTPKVFKGKVVIGNGGTEVGPIRGYLAAYDAATGEEAWRFYTVPGNPADGFESDAMAMAAETWTGEWWKYGGGGTVWNGMTYDPEFDLLYIGTGNGARGTRRSAAPAEVTICFCAPSWRSIRTPANTDGTTRPCLARRGTTTPTWISCSPI